MPFSVRRKLVCDPEFLALPPDVREAFIVAFRELAVCDDPIVTGPGYFVKELRQNRRVVPDGIFSLHVSRRIRGDVTWRGVFFRRGAELVFFGFGPRDPDFYIRMARTREAASRTDDES